ncbi:AraC family transcriptional regulator [Enterobacter cloacae subsp. cloacae]|nr:AraC family transcriptional regulator [Enterobacter cloacae subsp. cloacae]
MPLINVAIARWTGLACPLLRSLYSVSATRVSGEKRFNVTICAEKPGVLTLKRGLCLLTRRRIFQLSRRRILWWCPTGSTCWIARLRCCSTALVQARDNGAEIVGLCLGSFVLAYAGILDGKRAATHWEFEHHFQSLFPRPA